MDGITPDELSFRCEQMRGAGILPADADVADAQRLISYANRHDLSLDIVGYTCSAVRRMGQVIPVLTTAGFLQICRSTGLWRPGTVTVVNLAGPYGLVATAVCQVRDTIESSEWYHVSVVERWADHADRDMRSPLANPTYTPSLWTLTPTRMLSQAAEVSAAWKGIGHIMAKEGHWHTYLTPQVLEHQEIQRLGSGILRGSS